VAENGSEKPLTAPQARAAALVAADELSDAAIAAELGIGERTLYRWKELPAFQGAVAAHVAKVQAAMLRLDVAKRHKRLAVLDDLHRKMLAVIEERGAAMKDDAPGAGTGLIVRDLKVIGGGEHAQTVEVFAFDRAIVAEVRATHEQAAKELGQWTEKVEHGGAVERRVRVVLDEPLPPPATPEPAE
jgi:hypothetical protein